VDSGLYVVATPIGNLADLAPRAVEVLRAADLIACEDTRHSARLFRAHDIATPTIAYHDHSERRALQRVGECLDGGGRVALVSDAGTPLISDPGYRLVRHAQERGHPVRPVPGSCAAVAALSVGGLPTDRFLFEGFLPARQAARENRLAALANQGATLVFYEAPHRVAACLDSMTAVFGPDREAVLARELTKAFETVIRDTLAGLAARVEADGDQRRGEIVLLVAGAPDLQGDIPPDISALLRRLAEEMPAKRACAVLAEHTGLRKNALYDHLLALKK